MTLWVMNTKMWCEQKHLNSILQLRGHDWSNSPTFSVCGSPKHRVAAVVLPGPKGSQSNLHRFSAFPCGSFWFSVPSHNYNFLLYIVIYSSSFWWRSFCLLYLLCWRYVEPKHEVLADLLPSGLRDLQMSVTRQQFGGRSWLGLLSFFTSKTSIAGSMQRSGNEDPKAAALLCG